ncbi:MAG: sigma-54-dependent Fis family transcriptional regulator, partial [Desulfuromonadales bacterium]|nr:sigma-54-dependent Fis family transcriptional regulator [Desulfuromonadales bacterium]
KMVQKGTFRGDLLYRLNMMCLTLKPLRDRKKCIPSMVEYFIGRLNAEYGRSVEGISSEALRLLMAHHWPGNVRELRNALERAMMLESGKILSTEHFCVFPGKEHTKSGGCAYGCSVTAESTIILPPEGISIEEVEKEYIKQALSRHNNNQTKAAKCLGLTLDTLRYRRKKFGLEKYPETPSPILAATVKSAGQDSSKVAPG